MYVKKIVTFIDILGFRQLVARRDFKEVHKILSTFKQVSGADDESEAGEPDVVNFSDSVVRVQAAEESGDIFYELLSLVYVQSQLAEMGVLMRGGVALGDVHIEDDVVFGPALVEAYDMESKFSRVPRITLSPSVLAAYASDGVPKTWGREHEDDEFKGLLSQDDDGVWWIDYARAIATEGTDEGDYGIWLRAHGETTRTLIADAQSGARAGLTSLALKAQWLGRYHNAIVAHVGNVEWEACGLDPADVLVDLARLRAHFEFDDQGDPN